MKLLYKNNKVDKICNNLKHATKVLGPVVAKRLMNIISILEDYENLYDFSKLPQYNLHSLHGDRKYEYSIVIMKNTKWRLIIYPLDENGKLITDKANEKELLVKSVKIEVREVSEHYEK